MDLESVMLREVSHTEKEKYSITIIIINNNKNMIIRHSVPVLYKTLYLESHWVLQHPYEMSVIISPLYNEELEADESTLLKSLSWQGVEQDRAQVLWSLSSSSIHYIASLFLHNSDPLKDGLHTSY